jgi:hypothetical protein
MKDNPFCDRVSEISGTPAILQSFLLKYRNRSIIDSMNIVVVKGSLQFCENSETIPRKRDNSSKKIGKSALNFEEMSHCANALWTNVELETR